MEFSSDCESIRTEDFATKFCEYVKSDTAKENGYSCEKFDHCATPTPRDEKYSDFLSRKVEGQHLINEIRHSPIKQLYNQTLDLESIATELFEDQIHNYHEKQMLSGHSAPTDSANTSLHLGNLSNVQPMRRDIMNKFLSKYSFEDKKLLPDMRYASLENNKINRGITNDNEKRQCSKKEVNWTMECKTSPNSQSRYTVDMANEIRQKSIRIQNEIHEERKRKLESIQEMNTLRDHTPREQLDIKVKELDQLTDRMRKARADREKITDELNSLRYKLKHKSNDLRSETRLINGKKISGESAFHETVKPNQNCTTIGQNQLNLLNSQLNEKKAHLKDLEERIRQRLFEIQDLESLGLSKQEIRHVIEERNELYDILRLSEENGNDRYELEKKLTEVKEDLSMEHKKSREKISKLEEELDNSFKKIAELYEERDRMSKELICYKETIQKQQDEVNELYIERNDLRRHIDKYKEEIETERYSSREMIQQERKRYESHLATEEAQTKIIIADLRNQLSALQSENNINVEKGLAFKSKNALLESECQKLRHDLDLQENEFRERTEKILDEKNHAIEKIRKDFYSKKEGEIQTLKIEFDSEQERTINNLKECYKQQITDLQMRLENKCQEIQDLKSDDRRLRQEISEKENGLKNHYETEMSRLREESKQNIESSEMKRRSEIETLKERYEGLLKKINQEIEEERCMNERLRISLDKANKDIVQESELAKKYKNEKTTAINKLKESAKEKLQEESKYMKEYYEKELEDQLKVVEQTMQDKNSEISAKCKAIKSLETQNSEMKNEFLNTVSDIIDRVQHQCTQMANEGKFMPPSLKNIKLTDDTNVHEVVQLLIKNLEICCQEYGHFFHESVSKIKNDKDASVKMMEEKSSRDIQAIKEQILKDHADELNTLNMHHRQELQSYQRIQHEEIECLRRNVKEWKQKTADRLAQKLQKEFCKEIERKSTKQDINRSSSLSLRSFKNDVNPNTLKPIGLIEDLRANIRQLRDENLSLRKVILGQNVLHLKQYDDDKDTDDNLENGLIHSNSVSTRPRSVGHDSIKHRNNSVESSITRSGSYRCSKQ